MKREQITDEMVEAFGYAWHATPEGAEGSRRRAGLAAAMRVRPTSGRAFLCLLAGNFYGTAWTLFTHDEYAPALLAGLAFVLFGVLAARSPR